MAAEFGPRTLCNGFRDNEVDWGEHPRLTAEDLKDLGVVLGGHSRRLLDAVAALDTPAGIAGRDRRR